MTTNLRAAIMRFVRANIVSPDPTPEYSRLDRMDGLR